LAAARSVACCFETDDLKLHQAAQRAIDRYLNPDTDANAVPEPTALFSVTSRASNETLIANSYETISSVSALLLDLSNELTGKDRDVAMAIHQLSELGVLLIGKLMDRETPCR
jgi:LmbE family N-acetylglucosaminyl deacetylase